MNLPLDFGIRGLTTLMQPAAVKLSATPPAATWTAAIVGPDGCGKSILALHLASRYWRDHCEPSFRPSQAAQEILERTPRVIYVSTDLSHEQASGQWHSFGLDHPRHRDLALAAAYDNEPRGER